MKKLVYVLACLIVITLVFLNVFCTPFVKDEGTCTDGVMNGNETGPDCGGSDCDPCATGGGCAKATDCASGMCVNGECVDLDCIRGSDCASGVCVNGVCVEATCTDEVKNDSETDIDCGGSCTACADGLHCTDGGDCASGVCDGGLCQAPTCTDGVKNGTETDTDCGGGVCGACASGKQCDGGGDCATGLCVNGTCVDATCTDGLKNGAETDIDCGGPSCAKCAASKVCSSAGDCASGVCSGGVCQTPTCSDGVKNGTETDVDCGGSCTACVDGRACNASSDCTSKVCKNHVCQTPNCSDTVKNGTETDVDCGGPSCSKCATDKTCASGVDCTSGVCTGGVCKAPACNDGVRNGNETDTDCGGSCTACVNGKACVVAGDCTSKVCTGHVCQVPTCSDGVQNGTETDVDCGGSTCSKCVAGKKCTQDSDCTYYCSGTVCASTNAIVAAGSSRRWTDGTYATSCARYRFPLDPHYVYAGSTGDGIYTIKPSPTDAAFDAWCDMTTDGGGWTLVLLNSQYNTTPKPTWFQAINEVNVQGNLYGGLSAFDLLTGLKFWSTLGSWLRLDWGPSYNTVVRRAYMDYSLNAGNFYAVSAANLRVALGDRAPGFYDYHAANGFKFSTRDIDNDTNTSGSCSQFMNNTAWWYGSCWSGSYWGGGGGASFTNNPYWWSSDTMYSAWGAFWVRPPGLRAGDGTSSLSPAASCKAIYDAGYAQGDGLYWLNPAGNTLGPYQAWCDMTTDGGGYTYKRIDDAVNLLNNQLVYKSTCAAYGLQVIVPRTRAHALAIKAWNGGAAPNLVGVYPKTNGAIGLQNWVGKCQGGDCPSFWVSDTNWSNCGGTEPNGDNSTSYMLYRYNESGCGFWATYMDGNNNVAFSGSVICSTNDK
jgi:hypothetical protein